MSPRGLLVAAALCGASPASARPVCERVGSNFAPSVSQAPCPEEVGAGPGATCHEVRVAEVPGDPRSCLLRWQLVRLPARAATADAEPAILLPGGPGQALLHDLPAVLDVIEPWRARRDVLVPNPRGAGRPSLLATSPRLQRALRRHDPADGPWLGRIAAWYRRRGLQLDAYRVDVLADDVAAALDLLGIARVHVVGGSFGTLWAQALVRRHPDRVASLLLDAVVPADVNLFEAGPQAFLEALDRVFVTCGEQPACAARLPDPWGTVWATFADLARAPLELPGPPWRLDARGWGEALYGVARQSKLLPKVPVLVEAVARRDAPVVAALIAGGGAGDVVPLLHALVVCADWWHAVDTDTAAAAIDARLPWWSPWADLRPVCDGLGVKPSGPDARRVPRVEVPALLLAGRYEPGGPAAAWLTALEERWPTARSWLAPDAAHGVLRSACGREIGGAWLAEPAEFTWPACVAAAQPPTFVTELPVTE